MENRSGVFVGGPLDGTHFEPADHTADTAIIDAEIIKKISPGFQGGGSYEFGFMRLGDGSGVWFPLESRHERVHLTESDRVAELTAANKKLEKEVRLANMDALSARSARHNFQRERDRVINELAEMTVLRDEALEARTRAEVEREQWLNVVVEVTTELKSKGHYREGFPLSLLVGEAINRERERHGSTIEMICRAMKLGWREGAGDSYESAAEFICEAIRQDWQRKANDGGHHQKNQHRDSLVQIARAIGYQVPQDAKLWKVGFELAQEIKENWQRKPSESAVAKVKDDLHETMKTTKEVIDRFAERARDMEPGQHNSLASRMDRLESRMEDFIGSIEKRLDVLDRSHY